MADTGTSFLPSLRTAARRKVKAGATRHVMRAGVLVPLSLIAALIIASAWLVFPYALEGRGLIADVGDAVQSERRQRATTIGQFLTRYADGPGEAEIDVLYATERFFSIADRSNARDRYRPDKYLVFFINEATHTQDLPLRLPDVTLIVDGRQYAPVDVDGPIDVTHHRSTTVRFAAFDRDGKPIVPPGASELKMRVVSDWDDARTPRTVAWTLPFTYPEATENGLWTPVMILALSAGLLSAVLTPCLLQLLVVYFVTLMGVSVDDATRANIATAAGGRRVFYAALAFVAGFTILYTAAGAAIGYAGKEMQILSAEWSRQAGIGAGLLIIAMAIWFGVKTRAPMVCKIPKAVMLARFDKNGLVGSALVAAGFSFGCLTCFSGAIVATLLVYVGTLGSAPIGALVLFLFSLGVGIPFLAGALFLSRAMPAMTWLSRFAPQIGFVTMVLMAGFGLLLITDNFHELSDMIYPWLGLA